MGRTRLPVPRGFRPFKTTKGKINWKCSHTEVRNNELYHCGFYTRASKSFDPSSHTEHTMIKVNMNGLIENGTPLPQLIDDSDTAELYQLIFLFTGIRNVSLSALSSDEFWNILKKAYTMGKENKPEFKVLSRYTFTNKFCTFSEALRATNLKKLAAYNYASLTIDAGTNNMRPYLVVLVADSFSGINPIVYKLIPKFKGQCNDYIKKIYKIIHQLLETYNITVTSCITDNLVAQVSALDEKSEKSISKRYISEIFTSFIRFPCYNHTLALAINDFANESDIFEDIKDIKKFSLLLRSRQAKIALGSICPGYVITRWTVIFDITFWMYQHVNQIISLFYFPPTIIEKVCS